jgi:extracellular factor (EF) 3-hydroxypalmitic acid methyl ester biosynthesis protein
MNQVVGNSGNGHDEEQLHEFEKIARSKRPSPSSGVKESWVTFRTAEGLEMRGVPARVLRHTVVFELHNPGVIPRFSEVLSGFKIVLQDRPVYSGRAVIRSVVNAGLNLVCEATLHEANWKDVDPGWLSQSDGRLTEQFKAFLEEWQKLYRVLPEFKIVVADLQTFLTDLRIWLEQIELGIRASPSGAWAQIERRVIDSLAEPVIQGIDTFIDRFESIAARLEPNLQPAHRAYLRRQLHPLLLGSPFAYRAFHKPLGYAGDYEMVNMIARNPQEGGSLFAKMVNVWLLSEWPAKAHRNRLAYLADRLQMETLRATQTSGGRARIFNVACGPAIEVQSFLRNSLSSDHAELTLADFNRETIDYASKAISDVKKQFRRRTSIQFQKKSVHQILKEDQKPIVTSHEKPEYDFIYCSGLFDYLADNTCKQLMNIFHGMLAPGGLLLATNVNDVLNISRPFHYSMEYILDWHLIYRGRNRVAALAPDGVAADDVVVKAENTGTNMFLEVRKPNHA